MDIKFPFNKDVEQAQEKILQAKSAQEIKDLLKSDNPQKPNYQEGLIRLVSQHIMKQFSPEEIDRIESLSPYPEKNNELVFESSKLAKKLDDDTSRAFFEIAVNKFDSNRVVNAIPNTVLDLIKKSTNNVEGIFEDVLPKIKQEKNLEQQTRQIEIARKAGYVQGVCECVAAIGDDHALGKKLLTEMNVNKDMAKKFANPETFKALEQGIFAQKHEQNLEQTQGIKR